MKQENNKNQSRDRMKNVLVVDDKSDILTLVSVNLQVRGYQVAEAKNGTEALAQLRAEPPSLMVLDIKLPDVSGWEVLKGIMEDPQIRVWISSSHYDRLHFRNLYRFGNLSKRG